MPFSTIVPFLLTLLAPTEPASAAAPDADVTTAEEAEAEAPDSATPAGDPAATPSEATPPEPAAGAPAAVTSPFQAPPPAAVTAPPLQPTPPPPPRPIRWRLDIAPGAGATIVKDLGFRAFSGNRSLIHVDVSTVFDFRLGQGRFFVGGGVAYAFAGRTGWPFDGDVGPRLRLHEPRLLGRASFMAVEGVDVFARVGVGPSIARLDVDSSYGDFDYHRAEQRTAVLPRIDGEAGLSLYLPKRVLPPRQAARVTAGIELGLGYAWRGKLGFEPVLARGDDTIRVTSSDWGNLSLHGLTWAARLFIRVM